MPICVLIRSPSRTVPKGHLVAIKVLDIDNADYKTVRDLKDESIKDFIHETKVMRQVKDSGAKNVNMIIEAISIHSQLWLVCEYCPGGSVKTLVSSPLTCKEFPRRCQFWCKSNPIISGCFRCFQEHTY